ncbi:MAG: hypothetical protein VX367_11655, partial [SAR324 cluster bacterium]|nr:hypothetical protein [SAR324 cluster bacterium]
MHGPRRVDAWLPQSRAGEQGLYLSSLYHSGRSSEAEDLKPLKKGKCDSRTDGRTDRRKDGQTNRATKQGVELRNTRQKQ